MDGVNAETTDRVNEPAMPGRPHTVVGEKKLQFPCSPGQRHFWLLHQLNPRHPSLNITARWRLESAISNAELENAFRLIMARHQVLRTSFTEAGGEVNQIVEPHVSFHIPIIDLTGLPEADALIETERIARVEACVPFELSAPPLMRVTHMRLGIHDSVLSVTLHHIISDDRSIDILAREMSEVCATRRAGRAPVLPDLPINYGDFSVWQAEQYALAQQTNMDFWKRELQDVRHFEIPPDRPRPPVFTANRSILSVPLNGELTDGLADLAHHNDATLFVTVLAALLTLLHRYTDETDIVIGSQFAGRDGAHLGNLAGLFCNNLVLRNDLSGDPSFVVLLARIRDSVAESLMHRHIALEKLIEIVKSKRDLNRNPLFSVNFMFQQANIKKNDNYAGFKQLPPPSCFAGPTDLNFSLVEGPEGWSVSCEYNLDLFESQTIIRLLDHFKILLCAVVADPARKISTLTILDDFEHRELVVENNRRGAIYPKHLTLSLLFETQAKRTPEAIAVICGHNRMSYRELDIASNRLAHELRRRGVEPATRVAVLLDRSPGLMVALLAVLKSGGAYIPLDPAYPTERLQYIFEHSRPVAIITQASLRGRLVHEATSVITVDSQSLSIAKQSAEALVPTAAPTDPAYVIYTSGSTGRPKGVTIHHRALINLLCAMRRQPGLTDKDTVISVTTISFDMSVPDLFLPLIVGAKLILAQEQEMADGAALVSLLRRHNATFMQATPVTWQLLLEAGWHGDPPLKMLCGGEAMPRKLAESLLDCGGELWNMYGPTETTVWSSALRVESGDGPVPIGPPIDNTQFYILDSRQELVPRGVPGELFIGGDGVAFGYFDLPEVTREKFVPDKFRKLPGARLYRTGDMVRMKQHGHMDYIGRIDNQIKLRGFRIELGEIETALLRHPDIAEAVAVLGQNPSGEGAIWAYAVSRRVQPEPPGVLIDALRARLAQSLPGYMHPSSIVMLDALPRTPNGKIDRRSLPAPAPVKCQSKDAAQPLNEIECRLAKIWSSVLGLDTIDKTADFFDLGGHSLLAARLLTRIDAEFGQRLSLQNLFIAPSIAEQARLLMHGDQREYDFRQTVRLQPNGSKPPLIAIHNTGVYYYHLSRRLGPDQPLTTLQLFDPAIALQSLPLTLEDIATEYVRLIHKFQADGPYKLIGWCVGGVLAFEVARQLVEAGHEVSQLILIDAWAPGHQGRLSRPRAILADYSYRWQLIGADWRKVMSRQQSLAAFFAQRALVKKMLRRLDRTLGGASARTAFETRALSAENYDQWLLGYLEEMAQGYEPKMYPGKITLMCSTREPRGLFLDPRMGWGAFASGGVDVAVIDGDHFTMFNGPGLEQMATHISSDLRRSVRRAQPA
ncbi:MAG: non-ribosomal peptide synthetase [Gammaproteobacteria bacterium]